MLAFSDLLKVPSVDSIKTTLLNNCKALGLKVENWSEGGITRTIIAVQAFMLSLLAEVVPNIAKLAALDEATGDLLTLKAWDMYRVERIEAITAKAANAIVLTNTGGGLYTFDPGDIVFAHAVTNKTYRNTSGGTLLPGAGKTLALDIEAEEAGTASNALPGTITAMVTTFLGITCSNTLALVGVDAESDAALRQRCRDKIQTIGGGTTEGAIRYWLTSARRDDGTGENYGITRVQMMPADGYGHAVTYIATASGSVPGADVTALQDYINRIAFPYTGAFDLQSATPKNINAACTVWIAAGGLTAAEVRATVAEALDAYVQGLPIGGSSLTDGGPGFVFWRAIVGVIERAVPSIQAHLDTEADIPMAAGDVAMNATLGLDIKVVIV